MFEKGEIFITWSKNLKQRVLQLQKQKAPQEQIILFIEKVGDFYSCNVMGEVYKHESLDDLIGFVQKKCNNYIMFIDDVPLLD